MYKGKYAPVNIPNIKGIVVAGTGYVYYSNISGYDSEKKHSTDNRVIIGKVVEGYPDMMTPNDKFFDIFSVPSSEQGKNVMMSEIHIENFRGIKRLDVQNMRPIVLVSGKNNVGKTSFLEALFLLMSRGNASVFQSLNVFRNRLFFNATNTEVWEPLFYMRDPNNKMSITSLFEGKNLSLTLQKDESHIPNATAGLPNGALEQLRLFTMKSYSLKGFFAFDDKTNNFHISSSPNGILTENDKRHVEDNNNVLMARFVSDSIIRGDASITDLFGKAELEDKKQFIIDILKMIDTSITDVTNLAFAGNSSLYIRNDKGLLPIQFAGDGINKLIYLALSIMQTKNGIVLIDELESGFHYTMLSNVWRMIATLSEEYNCQIVATTHSIENIGAAISGLRGKESDFCYYRLGRNEETIEAHRFSYDILKSALKSELEVR